MRALEHDVAQRLSARDGAPDDAAVVGVEVTPEMIWAALEEWSGFDDARDDLDRFLERLYRAMETVCRNTGGRRVPSVTYVDLRHLP